jgi:hypothetical protein
VRGAAVRAGHEDPCRAQDAVEPNARASEKRADTTTVPGACAVTDVHPPGALRTQPLPRTTVQ